MTIEEHREYLRDKLDEHYGVRFIDIDDNKKLESMDAPIFDTYVDLEDRFRVTVYMNTEEPETEKVSSIVSEALHLLKDTRDRIIIILDMFEYEEDYPVTWEELIMESSCCPGLWVLTANYDKNHVSNDLAKRMFSILDGKIWRVGHWLGKEQRLALILRKTTCSECGKEVWLPDSIAVLAASYDEKGNNWIHNLWDKPLMLSLKSIHVYSDEVKTQVSAFLEKSHQDLCIMSKSKNHAFDVSCPSCKNMTASYGVEEHDWFSHEMNETWYRWFEDEPLPNNLKIIQIPDVSLDMEALDILCNSYTAAPGFIYKGEYTLNDCLVKMTEMEYEDIQLAELAGLQIHLNENPIFHTKFHPSPAAITVDRCNMMYKHIMMLGLGILIGKYKGFDND